MRKPTVQELEAMNRLSGDPTFEIFMGWIKDSADESQKQMTDQKEETLLRWKQGGTQELNNILESVSGARESIQAIRERANRK